MTQSYPAYDWVRTTRFTVPLVQAPEEKQTYFVTNCPVTDETASALAESYQRRWGIETSYRVIGDFQAKSRSTIYSVRLFYFRFAVTLYNRWVLCNRLLTEVFGWELDLPPVPAAVFGRLIRRQWMADLFAPVYHTYLSVTVLNSGYSCLLMREKAQISGDSSRVRRMR